MGKGLQAQKDASVGKFSFIERLLEGGSGEGRRLCLIAFLWGYFFFYWNDADNEFHRDENKLDFLSSFL